VYCRLYAAILNLVYTTKHLENKPKWYVGKFPGEWVSCPDSTSGQFQDIGRWHATGHVRHTLPHVDRSAIY
jgi:hypothetical protein